MKAEKLIINGEEQNLSQVFSVNGQTGDVTVNSTPGVTYVKRRAADNEYYIDAGDLNDGDLVVIDVGPASAEPTTSITIQGTTYDINGYDENSGWDWSEPL